MKYKITYYDDSVKIVEGDHGFWHGIDYSFGVIGDTFSVRDENENDLFTVNTRDDKISKVEKVVSRHQIFDRGV